MDAVAAMELAVPQNAAPAPSGTQLIGLMRRALALRRQFSLNADGSPHIKMLPLDIMGVHQLNRSGHFPNGDACVDLGCKVLRDGFVLEEALSQGICVQEVPESERHRLGNLSNPMNQVYETILNYNLRKSAAVAALAQCFRSTMYCNYGTLAHSHLLLILLAFQHGAKWTIPADATFDPLRALQNAEGEWIPSAVAAFDGNYQQLLTCGLRMEILDYRILFECPEGPSIIAQAYNKMGQNDLKQHVFSVLSAVAVQVNRMQSPGGDEVAFYLVKDALQHELDHWVQEEHFISTFEFVVNMGGLAYPFVPWILWYAEAFVNPRLRKLRLEAFAILNKMGMDKPWTKVSVLCRMLRADTKMGWCPCPDTWWGADVEQAWLISVEDMLVYCLGVCKDAVASMPLLQQNAWKANTCIACADTYVQWRQVDAKLRKNAQGATIASRRETLQDSLLRALRPEYDELQKHCTKATKEMPNAMATANGSTSPETSPRTPQWRRPRRSQRRRRKALNCCPRSSGTMRRPSSL